MATNTTQQFSKNTTQDVSGIDAAYVAHRVNVSANEAAGSALGLHYPKAYLTHGLDTFSPGGCANVELRMWSTASSAAVTATDIEVWAWPYPDRDGNEGGGVCLLKAEVETSGQSYVGVYPPTGKTTDPKGASVLSLIFHEADGYQIPSGGVIATDQVKPVPDDSANSADTWQLRFLIDAMAYAKLHVRVTDVNSARVDVALRRVS